MGIKELQRQGISGIPSSRDHLGGVLDKSYGPHMHVYDQATCKERLNMIIRENLFPSIY